MRAVKTYPLDRVVRAAHSVFDIVAQCCHAEHAPAVGHDLAGGIAFRAGLKHRDVSQLGGLFQSLNHLPAFVGAGITGRRHDDAHGYLAPPIELELVECAIGDGDGGLGEIEVHPRHNYLRFGVAEATVKLQHFRSVLRDHQPGVEDTLVFDAFRPQAGQRALENLSCIHIARYRRIRTHAPGVWPGIAFKSALMVLRRRQQLQRLAVNEYHHARLFAGQTFLDDDLRTGFTKDALLHDVHDRLFGFRNRLRDDDAFAPGQSIGFDNHRCAMLADVLLCSLRVVENFCLGGRNVVPQEELFRENLAAFEPGSGTVRSKDAQAPGAKPVGDAGAQWSFRADDGQIELVLCGKRFIGDGHALGQLGNTGIAGRAEQFCDAPALSQFPNQRMLATAAANDKDSHRSRGRNSRRARAQRSTRLSARPRQGRSANSLTRWRSSFLPINTNFLPFLASLPANEAVCVAVPKSLTVYAPTRLSLVTNTAPDMVNEPPLSIPVPVRSNQPGMLVDAVSVKLVSPFSPGCRVFPAHAPERSGDAAGAGALNFSGPSVVFTRACSRPLPTMLPRRIPAVLPPSMNCV